MVSATLTSTTSTWGIPHSLATPRACPGDGQDSCQSYKVTKSGTKTTKGAHSPAFAHSSVWDPSAMPSLRTHGRPCYPCWNLNNKHYSHKRRNKYLLHSGRKEREQTTNTNLSHTSVPIQITRLKPYTKTHTPFGDRLTGSFSLTPKKYPVQGLNLRPSPCKGDVMTTTLTRW